MNQIGRVAGLILAAGRAERFSGEVKALLPFGPGTILESVVQAAASAGTSPLGESACQWRTPKLLARVAKSGLRSSLAIVRSGPYRVRWMRRTLP